MEAFSEVIRSISKYQLSILLFLNKVDLLEKKIKDENHFQDFKKYFPDFKGEAKIDDCCEHIKDQFMKTMNEESENLEVHTHVTCALDTDGITACFEAVKENIFMKRIASSRVM